METKKTVKIMVFVVLVAILFFLGVLFLNNHIENKEAKNENPISSEEDFSNLDINSLDLQEGEGNLEVLVYEDYSDAFSADFNKTINQLKADFPGQLHFAYRFFNSSDSSLANELALAITCAQEQSQGLGMRQEMFNSLGDNLAGETRIETAALNLDLNKELFDACLGSPEKKERIKARSLQASQLPVYGTPTTFIGEDIVVGAKPYDNFTDSNGDEMEGLKQIVERQLN